MYFVKNIATIEFQKEIPASLLLLYGLSSSGGHLSSLNNNYMLISNDQGMMFRLLKFILTAAPWVFLLSLSLFGFEITSMDVMNV